MPLGPQLMRGFSITTQQFGLLVSSYTFSAAMFGLLSSFFLDRFDRKKALLTIYLGFIVGTLACAVAPQYELLLLARIVAGAFGGVLGALGLSIVGDQIPENRRGAATGILMSSFSMASILGVPLGLGLAALSTWHLPFLVLGFSSLVIALAAAFLLPGMRGHLNHHQALSPINNFVSILQTANLRWALAMIFCLMFAGFSVIPFLSPSLVFNAGMKEAQLPLLYFFGGAFTLFSSRWIGGLADRYGKPRIFRIFGLISIVPILIITNLHVTPLPIILVCTTFFMVVVTGRVIPAMALITSSVHPWQRGSFMSLNSSVQMAGSALAALFAGMILQVSPQGKILNYPWVGLLAIFATLVCLWLVGRIKPAAQPK